MNVVIFRLVKRAKRGKITFTMQKNSSRNSEFHAALAQVANERDLDISVIIDAIKQSILAALKKDHPEAIKEGFEYEVSLDGVSGEVRIFELVDAKKKDITPPGFGRIAAQTAKQVILQKIREAEKGVIIAEYEKKLGTLVNGLVLRFIGGEVIVDLGKVEAVVPSSEQVPNDNYHINQRLVFYVDSIRESVRGKEIVVSRGNPSLVIELFRREVPEVASGAVEVKAVARDAGIRTKIAVYSTQSGVDPVGSCVGQKGVRVQAVINDLNNEKIDVIQFNEDKERFVAAALAPATGLEVKCDATKKIAVVFAPTDQLSLAIGREGQNARLAGKLTDYHIDIKPLDTQVTEVSNER